jgi:TMEM175 potassium channel family protein
MNKNRVEAFSDGVLAIIVTIMVLEMKVPHEGGATWAALKPVFPVFLSYILSFSMVWIYWNNHHHLFHSVKRVNGKVLLANGHLLFWLSLMPFATAWMGENHFASLPVALFGFVLAMSAIAYFFLTRTLIHLHGSDSLLAHAIGRDSKGWFSLAAYLTAILISFAAPKISCLIYAGVALVWLIPDKRIEKLLDHEP